MTRIVVSAFKPFGTYCANSTLEVLEILMLRGTFEIIPVVYKATIPTVDRGKELVDLAHEKGASAILSLGMASEKRGVCIEFCGTNAINNPKYCSPTEQGTAIRSDRTYGETINLDLTPWSIKTFTMGCGKNHIPVEVSIDAGGFCCNHLAYQTRLAILEGELRLPFLFVHIPCSPEAVPNMEDFTQAGKVTRSPELMADAIELLVQGAQL